MSESAHAADATPVHRDRDMVTLSIMAGLLPGFALVGPPVWLDIDMPAPTIDAFPIYVLVIVVLLLYPAMLIMVLTHMQHRQEMSIYEDVGPSSSKQRHATALGGSVIGIGVGAVSFKAITVVLSFGISWVEIVMGAMALWLILELVYGILRGVKHLYWGDSE